MVDRFDPEELLVCPYDPIHRIARKRLHVHLVKCRKNYNTKDYAVCPFNATHVIPKPELSYHITYCEDRGRVELEIYHNSSTYKSKGDTSIPSHDWKPPPSEEESWDDDNVKYVPKQSDELFDSTQNLVSEPPFSTDSSKKTTPPPPPQVRMPKSSPSSQSVVYSYSVEANQRGRGRGMGRGTSNGKAIGRGRGMFGRGPNLFMDAAPPGLINPHFTMNSQLKMDPSHVTTNQLPSFPMSAVRHVTTEHHQPGYHMTTEHHQPGYHMTTEHHQPGYHMTTEHHQPGYHMTTEHQQPGYHMTTEHHQPGYHMTRHVTTGQSVSTGQVPLNNFFTATKPSESESKTPLMHFSQDNSKEDIPPGVTNNLQASQETESELKESKKKVRKLSKMLRQIGEIEDKKSKGGTLQPEQIAKLHRKQDVIDCLRKAEEELARLELHFL